MEGPQTDETMKNKNRIFVDLKDFNIIQCKSFAKGDVYKILKL